MSQITLAGGQQVNVNTSNQGAVTVQAIAAAKTQAAATGNSFGYADEVALRTAVGNAAQGTGTGDDAPAPTDYSIFGTGDSSLTGQLGSDLKAGIGQLGSDPKAFAANLSSVLQADIGPYTDKLGLPPIGSWFVFVEIGVVFAGIFAVAYIIHELK